MSDEIPPSFTPGGGREPSRSRDSERSAQSRRRATSASSPHPSGNELPPTIPPRIAHTPRSQQLPPQYAPASAQRQPGGQQPQQQSAPQQAPQPAPRPKRRRRSRAPRIIAFLLILILAWPVGLLIWADSKIQHTEALSSAGDTPGHTYLLVGSDSRADGQIADETEGERADTIILLHRPASGASSMISLPRDTYVDIPGHGANKLNAAYFYGGAPLLVETVEGLTGMTVDHYVEIGMGGVVDVVDAVGGVELCLDYDVDDARSELDWTAGCHESDGDTALAFARMRYSDPYGDFGRQERQRQVIGAVTRAVATPATLFNPIRHVSLIDAGLSSIVTDEDTGIIDLGRLALAFRAASGSDGVTGAPPIASMNYQPGGIGSAVLLAENSDSFFQKVLDGTITENDVAHFE